MMRDRIEEGLIDSGLSLGERIMSAYWETEKAKGEGELESPNYYKNKLSEIVSNIKSEIDKGKTAEESICAYLNRLEYAEDTLLTKTLNSGKVDCVSSTSLFLILAEMLDYNFGKYNIGRVPEHVFIRKEEGEHRKNIDRDGVYADDDYLEQFNRSPEDIPKEVIISSILSICGYNLDKRKSYGKAIKYYDKALEIDSSDAEIWNNKGITLSKIGDCEEALKCYDKALEIRPNDFIMRLNKRKVLDILEYDKK